MRDQSPTRHLKGSRLFDWREAGGVFTDGRARSGMAGATPVVRCGDQAALLSGEIRGYLEGVRRVGPLGHVLSDDKFEEFRAAGALEDDPVGGAEDVLRVECARRLLTE